MSALIETEIGTIAPEWKVAPLECICEPPEYGYTASAETEGNVRFLRITDITDSGVNWPTVPFCECPPEVIGKYRLACGDIVFARIGATTGKSYLITNPPPSVFASYLIRVRAKREIDPTFLSQFFRSDAYWRQVNAQKNANLKKGVSGSLLKTLVVPVPPLPEQRKIAAVLGLVQRAIEQQERLIALTTELKRALLHKLFTEGLRGEPQKQTEFGPVPESWELLPLERVISQKIVDGVHKTPTYIDSGIPFITAKDIVENKISFSECRYIPFEEHKQLTRRVRPRRGDVFLTKVGTVGNVGIVDFDDEFSFFVQLALIRPNPEHLLSDYLYWSLQYGAVQSEISSNAPQSTMKFIGTQKIAKIRIPVPPLAEQREIACSLNVVHSRIDIAQRKLEAMRDLFRTLLHQLMTAQIRVYELDMDKMEIDVNFA